MAEYADHEKAVVLDELLKELVEADWVVMYPTPDGDSWNLQIDGTVQVSKFTAEMIQDLMSMGEPDG